MKKFAFFGFPTMLLMALAVFVCLSVVSCDKDDDVVAEAVDEVPKGGGDTDDEVIDDSTVDDGNEDATVDDGNEDDGSDDGTDGPLDPSYVPMSLMPDIGGLTGTAGEFFIDYNEFADFVGDSTYVVSGMTEDEWIAFATTGVYDGKVYDVQFDTEDDFWTKYAGSGMLDNGMQTTIYYYDTDRELWQMLFMAFSRYRYDTTFNFKGHVWAFFTPGYDKSDYIFFYGLNSSITGEIMREDFITQDIIPVFDEYGRKYCFTYLIPSKDKPTHPNITFYTIVHVYEEE